MMIERCFLDWVRAIWIEISPSFSLTFIAQGSKFNENLHQKKSFKIYENFPSLDVYFEFCNFFHVWWSRRKSVKRRADCRVISVGESLKEKGKQKNLSKKGPGMNFSSPQITRDLFTWLNSVSFCSFVSLNSFHPHRSSSISFSPFTSRQLD